MTRRQERGEPTLVELADLYLKLYAKQHKRSWKQDGVCGDKFSFASIGWWFNFVGTAVVALANVGPI